MLILGLHELRASLLLQPEKCDDKMV